MEKKNDFQKLRKDAWNIFANAPEEKVQFYASKKLLRAESGEEQIEHFSEFNEDHLNVAKAIWTKLFNIANGNDTAVKGKHKVEEENVRIQKAVEYIRSLNQNPDLKQYAFMVFVTHNEIAKKILHGTIPSILVRNPLKVLPSVPENTLLKKGAKASKVTEGDVDEKKLNYLREDPLFNEHHEHWHVVYPNGGIPVTDEKGNITYKERERHGEMFVYMHQQMLAHYEAHRFALNMPKVIPYDFSDKVEVGYDPGTFVNQFGDINYSSRTDNWEVVSLPYITVTQQRTYISRLLRAMEQGYIESNNKKIRLNADLIGILIESLGGSVEAFGEVKQYYGNIHNMGHMLLSNAPGLPKPQGVMSQTATAIRDSVFYRWHKHIDNYSFIWQEKQKPNDFSDIPNVLIRNGFDYSPDIIICSLKNIADSGKKADLSAEELGQVCFGNENWNKDFTDGKAKVPSPSGSSVTVPSLETHSIIKNYIQEGKIEISDPNDGKATSVPYQFLNHEEYGFYIRLENKMPVTSKVTVRMFMVPKANAEDRRMWIELDKFVHVLQPNAKDVVFRRDLDSAIIRKPAITNPAIENIVYRPLAITDMESFYTQGVNDYIGVLKALVVESPDPENTPSLVTFYTRYITDPVDPELPEEVRIAAFKSLLNKYFNNLTIGWEEIMKTQNTQFQLAADPINKIFNRTKHEQSSDNVVDYYNSLLLFVSEQSVLLDTFKKSLFTELSKALLDAFQRVHDLAYCECGLPYNILYPRGTEEGLDYYMMVMVTDWNKDISSFENCCGSMSYCGTKTNYPDIREMGYPFNRPFDKGVLNTMVELESVAIRQFKIKLVDKE